MTTLFNNFEEFTASNPNEETVSKVLAFINRARTAEIKREIRTKKAELKKVNRVIEGLGKFDLEMSKEQVTAIKAKMAMITAMEQQLPAAKKATKAPAKKAPAKKRRAAKK